MQHKAKLLACSAPKIYVGIHIGLETFVVLDYWIHASAYSAEETLSITIISSCTQKPSRLSTIRLETEFIPAKKEYCIFWTLEDQDRNTRLKLTENFQCLRLDAASS